MKLANTFQSLILIGFLFFASNCSTGQRSVSINTIRPADITIPAEVQTILIVNRTKFDKKAANIIEGLLTGELPNEDKAAVQGLTNALKAELLNSPRFVVKLATEELSGNSLTSAFPEPLAWNQITELCTKYEADAILAIEIFDSDFIITNGVRKKKATVREGNTTKEIEVDEYYATGIDNIKMGVRLYEPATSQILDQQIFNKRGTWEAAAASKAQALLSLTQKAEANQQLSAKIGADYAYRISPMNVLITRQFRGKSKKTPELERGSRLADIGKWEEAIEIWKSGLTTEHEKDAGYLSYNIAVAYEILGEMELTKKWASDSYTTYGNKDAKTYLDLINWRLQDEQRANQQLEK